MNTKALFNENINELILSITTEKKLIDAEIALYPFAQHLRLLKGISSPLKKDKIIAQCYLKNSILNKYITEEAPEDTPKVLEKTESNLIENIVLEQPTKTVVLEQGNSFFSWLKRKVGESSNNTKSTSTPTPPPSQPTLLVKTEEPNSSLSLNANSKPSDTITETPEIQFSTPRSIYFDLEELKTPAKNKVDTFIESYLVHEPKITPKKTLPDNQEDLAKESNKVSVVSETLAKIYMQQGLHEKAAKAFEKLSLKYPEKNTYFAALAKEARSLKK